MSYRSRASIRLIGSNNSLMPTARRGSGGAARAAKIQPMAQRSRRSIWFGRLRALTLTTVAVLLLIGAWHGWALLAR